MYSLTHNTVVSVHSGVKISVKLYYFNNTNISLMLMLYTTRVGLHYTLACVHKYTPLLPIDNSLGCYYYVSSVIY